MTGNDEYTVTQNSMQSSIFNLLSTLSKEKLTGPNYMHWMRNLKENLWYENKEYVLEKPLVEIDQSIATPGEIVSFNKHSDDPTNVACIMVATMMPKLHKFYEDYWPYEMWLDLAEKFHKMARQEHYEVVMFFMVCKLTYGESIYAHEKRMQRYVEWLEKLNVKFDQELAIVMVLNSFTSSYDHFILTYHLNNIEMTLTQIHNLFQTVKLGMNKNHVPSAISAPILDIGHKKQKRGRIPPNPTGKGRPVLEHLVVGPIRSSTLMFQLLVTQRRPFASIVARNGIGKETAQGTFKSWKRGRSSHLAPHRVHKLFISITHNVTSPNLWPFLKLFLYAYFNSEWSFILT